MCQCMLCGCIWYNCCGVPCGGCHEANLWCSWWLCKPDDLRLIDPMCCHICACDGLGYNYCWDGCICCAPASVIEWSGLKTAGKTMTDLNKQTIIINNTSPIYSSPGGHMQYNQGYGNPGYGSPGPYYPQGPQGVQMTDMNSAMNNDMNRNNSNMSGLAPNPMNTSDGSANMNAKISF